MEPMTWRIAGFVAFLSLALAQSPASAIRGKLLDAEGRPVIETGAQKRVALDGEPETMAVLKDSRLAGADMELHGEFKTPALFVVGSFYTSKSMHVHRNGKKYTISYWCPVCSIRTYTPGKCMCCQQETHLDLEEVK